MRIFVSCSLAGGGRDISQFPGWAKSWKYCDEVMVYSCSIGQETQWGMHSQGILSSI